MAGRCNASWLKEKYNERQYQTARCAFVGTEV
jgi:hypothetical protein